MLGTNVGVDLGTSSVLVYVEGKGIVVNEPSVAAYSSETGQLIAVGRRAFEMLGRNPESIRVVKPMLNGVVSDFNATNHILRYYLSQVCKNMMFKPNIVVCVPSSVTKLEQRTILDLVTASGAAKACLIEEPLAAALGAGLSVGRPSGVMVVDIGGGTTDVAVITMGSISVSRSIRVAGNALDEAIVRYFRRERDVHFGERTAEKIKMKIGSACLREADLAIEARGKYGVTGMPARLEITSTEVYFAIRDQLDSISDAITGVLELTPPELAGDISDNGIILTGGSALLHDMDRMVRKDTGIRTLVCEDPITCVAMGTGIALKNIDLLISNGYMFQSREEITGYWDNALTEN